MSIRAQIDASLYAAEAPVLAQLHDCLLVTIRVPNA